VSVLLDCLLDRQLSIEPYYASTTLSGRDDLRLEVIGDVNRAARLELAAGVNHRFPGRVSERSQQEDLSGRSVFADAEQSGSKDARGVEDDRIAGGNELLEIGETPVRDLTGRAIHDHQPAVPTPRSRLLRDPVCGEIEIVV
jgi:hypothetical protein